MTREAESAGFATLVLDVRTACRCGTWRGHLSTRGAGSVDTEAIPACAAIFAYELERITATPRYTVSRLRFASPIATPDEENNVVHGEFFSPMGFAGKRPGVVVLHILGSDFPLSRYMAARLADRGVAALFLKLPYYGERRPKGGPTPVPRRFLSADIGRPVTSMQGICDVPRGISWLASRSDIDRARLGVAGISLGGIVASVAVAVDPAVRDGVFLLAGGDLSQILWGMPETERFRKSWEAAGRSLADLKALTDPFDPLTHAPPSGRETVADDRGEGQRGGSPRVGQGALERRRTTPHPLVRLRPLFSDRLPLARNPRDG